MDATDNVRDDAARRLEKLNFHHPYTPYDVQEQFMKTAYQVLETGGGQVGILESPTGTVRPKQAFQTMHLRPHCT